METLCEDLLFEVDLVHKLGLPGRIIVFGKTATAILTGQDEEDVILAAAVLGKGRIIVFAHSAYCHQTCDLKGTFQNSALYKNVRNWLTHKDNSQDLKILNLDSSKPINDVKVLQTYDILTSTGVKETVPLPLVEQYIKNGGAFLHATTPWGYLQLHNDKSLHDIPYIDILQEVGISYSRELSKDHGSGYAPELNKACDSNMCQCAASDLTVMIDKVGVLKQILELPPKHTSLIKNAIVQQWKEANDKLAKKTTLGKIKSQNSQERKLLEFCLLGIDLHDKKNFKAIGIKSFPGDFETLPSLVVKEIKFTSTCADYFFTSCYVCAGVEVILNVTKVTNQWTVIVGAHMDYLNDLKVNRWPKLTSKTEIKCPGSYDISNPFGGSVYFLGPQQSTIEATISNVVICPRFELTGQKKPWNESRNDPGLWADISGKYLTMTAPSSSIRNLDDPTEIMELFDELLVHYHDLRGTDINKERKMWVVADEQPDDGYMHAGYPIVTHLDVFTPTDQDKFLLSAKNFRAGLFWGIFHEMGHNMQQPEWTFSGAVEVTVNIFTLYGMFVMCGINTWIHPWLAKRTLSAVRYLKSGANFNGWKEDAGKALYIYAQLVNAFKWETYKRVFRRYQTMKPGDKPKSDQDKIDMWFLIFSEECKLDLSPVAIFWGFPLSDNGLKKIESLNFKAFLPADDFTKKVPERVNFVKDRFPNLVQSL